MFLFILSIIIGCIIIPFGIIYGFIKNLLGISKKSLNMALWVDIGGNVMCSELFNDLLIQNITINPFGNPRQTISEVLGINNQLLNITKTGQVLVNILNYLDPYHVEKTIKMKVPIVILSPLEKIKRFSLVLGVPILLIILSYHLKTLF